MITAAELASMRAAASDALPGTAVIQNYAETSDGGGGVTQAWTAAGTVDCRMAPIATAREGEQVSGSRISAEADSLFTLPHDAAITTNSRIIYSGGTFNVEAIRDRDWHVTTRVETVKQTS